MSSKAIKNRIPYADSILRKTVRQAAAWTVGICVVFFLAIMIAIANTITEETGLRIVLYIVLPLFLLVLAPIIARLLYLKLSATRFHNLEKEFVTFVTFLQLNNLYYVHDLSRTSKNEYEKTHPLIEGYATNRVNALELCSKKSPEKTDLLTNGTITMYLFRGYLPGNAGVLRKKMFKVAAVPLSKPMPHILIMGQPHIYRSHGSDNTSPYDFIRNQIDQQQLIVTNQVFDDHYTLYAPLDYQVDVLSVISPDFIIKLMEIISSYRRHNGGVTIEIVDNILSVYETHHNTKKEVLQRVVNGKKQPVEKGYKQLYFIQAKEYEKTMRTVDKLKVLLEQSIDTYRDHRATSPAQASRNEYAIADAGKRLKYTLNP